MAKIKVIVGGKVRVRAMVNFFVI